MELNENSEKKIVFSIKSIVARSLSRRIDRKSLILLARIESSRFLSRISFFERFYVLNAL
jgi:hypothetical protein